MSPVVVALVVTLATVDQPLDLVLGRHGYMNVPVRVGPRSGWWYTTVTVGGKPMTACLDTGAVYSHIDHVSAGRLVAFPQLLRDWSPAPARLTVGPLLMPRATLTAFDLRQMTVSEDGEQSDALIGLDVLDAGRAVFDFGGGRMYLRPAGRRDDPTDRLLTSLTAAGFVPVPVTPSTYTGARYVWAELHGQSVCLNVDSGAAQTAVFDDTARRLGVPTLPTSSRMTTLAGKVDVYRPVRTAVRLQRDVVPADAVVGICSRPAAWPAAESGGLRFDGVLGLPALTDLRAVYDVSARTLYVPAASWTPPDWTGAWWVDREPTRDGVRGAFGRWVRIGGGKLVAFGWSDRTDYQMDRTGPRGVAEYQLLRPGNDPFTVRLEVDGPNRLILLADPRSGRAGFVLRRIGTD